MHICILSDIVAVLLIMKPIKLALGIEKHCEYNG